MDRSACGELVCGSVHEPERWEGTVSFITRVSAPIGVNYLNFLKYVLCLSIMKELFELMVASLGATVLGLGIGHAGFMAIPDIHATSDDIHQSVPIATGKELIALATRLGIESYVLTMAYEMVMPQTNRDVSVMSALVMMMSDPKISTSVEKLSRMMHLMMTGKEI